LKFSDLIFNIEKINKNTIPSLYLILNNYSENHFNKPFPLLFIDFPINAFKILCQVSSEYSAKIIIKLYLEALGLDDDKVENLIKNLESGNDKELKELILKLTN
jgi:hypothetical protein